MVQNKQQKKKLKRLHEKETKHKQLEESNKKYISEINYKTLLNDCQDGFLLPQITESKFIFDERLPLDYDTQKALFYLS